MCPIWCVGPSLESHVEVTASCGLVMAAAWSEGALIVAPGLSGWPWIPIRLPLRRLPLRCALAGHGSLLGPCCLSVVVRLSRSPGPASARPVLCDLTAPLQSDDVRWCSCSQCRLLLSQCFFPCRAPREWLRCLCRAARPAYPLGSRSPRRLQDAGRAAPSRLPSRFVGLVHAVALVVLHVGCVVMGGPSGLPFDTML